MASCAQGKPRRSLAQEATKLGEIVRRSQHPMLRAGDLISCARSASLPSPCTDAEFAVTSEELPVSSTPGNPRVKPVNQRGSQQVSAFLGVGPLADRRWIGRYREPSTKAKTKFSLSTKSLATRTREGPLMLFRRNIELSCYRRRYVGNRSREHLYNAIRDVAGL